MVQGIEVRRVGLKPVIKLTQDCNLHCTYCYQSDSFASGQRVSFETLERIFQELNLVCTKPVSILWYGGEPTMYGLDDFTRAVERSEAVLGEVRHSIQTNGLLINEAWSRVLSKHRFGVTVSLDGPPFLHDPTRRNRGGGATHAAVVAGIGHLQEAGLSPRVACVVTARSVPHAEELVHFFSVLGITEVDFPPAMRFDADGRLEPFITAAEFGRFMTRALHCWLQLGRREFRIRSLVGLARRLAGHPGHYCKLEGDCSTYLTFTVNGDVYPCDEFSGLGNNRLGSILTDRLSAILFSDETRALFREWTRTPLRCHDCKWQSLCPGACPFERRASGALTQCSILCEAWKQILAELESLN